MADRTYYATVNLSEDKQSGSILIYVFCRYLFLLAVDTLNTMPSVTKLEWGVVETSDGHMYKDCIVTWQDSNVWNWKLDGTRHESGITPKAVRPVLDADLIILSQGVQKRLHIAPQTIALLEDNQKEYTILPTKKAVELFNTAMEEGKHAALLLHSTC